MSRRHDRRLLIAIAAAFGVVLIVALLARSVLGG